ncbi:forkhead box protein N1 [Polyodon spathula]|uniref:forkhead box protein N1 n=1 Tax=Polyodon spathula TaxID=7913 RepID=UPI001B7ECDE7|nr:forkhead box protein N1 [Polyodon spathula]
MTSANQSRTFSSASLGTPSLQGPPNSTMPTHGTPESPHLQATQTQDGSGVAEGAHSFRGNESALYSPKSCHAEKFRRHSNDGLPGQTFVTADQSHFHPYCWRFSTEEYPGEGGSPQRDPCSPLQCLCSFNCFGGLEHHGKPDAVSQSPLEHATSTTWANVTPYSVGQCLQSSRIAESKYQTEILAVPQETGLKSQRYQSQVQHSYSTVPRLQQFSTDSIYPLGLSGSPHYPYQRIAPQAPRDTQQSLYPKPIYSYSILIFMALRNSKTGSLPVSEIYNFMTEHFPYFKTAPDGWKNSVRHNLSLNKCFEKVENKSGSSSRKGCLWALNPAKVEKMQEELHKWRRKDPVTVRKSMARPEELDRLLGDKPVKYKVSSMLSPLPASHPSTLLIQGHPSYAMAPSFTSAQCAMSSQVHRHPLQVPTGALSHQPLFLPPAPQGFPHFSPSKRQQPPSGIPPNEPPQAGTLSSHPPIHRAGLQAEHCTSRSMQDLLMEGDLSNDIDTLNPSLTDFELQGHLWEDLEDDSLALDPLILIATSPSSGPSHWGGCLMEGGSGEQMPRFEDHSSLSDLHIIGTYSTTFTDLDSYLPTPGNAPIPLM